MYSLEYAEKAVNKLLAFVEYMNFHCRYRNSGLFNEEEIVNNFIESNYKFIDELNLYINEHMRGGFLGEIQESSEAREIRKVVCFIRSFTVVLICRYNHKSREITILDLNITV